MIVKFKKAAIVLSLQFFISLILLMSTVKGQLPLNHQAYHDSLYTSLRTQKNDSMKARTAFLLAHYWSIKKDLPKAEKYLTEGRSHFKNNRFLLGLYYKTIITLYTYMEPSKSQKALHKTDSLLSVFHTPDAYVNLAGAWYSEAIMAQRNSNEKRALWVIINKVIPLIKKSGDKTVLAKYYSQVGVLMMNRQLYEHAGEYFSKVISMKDCMPKNNNTLVRTYIYSVENLTYARKFKEAGIMLKEARKILDKNSGASDNGDYYLAEGRYFDEIGQYDKAIHSYNKGAKYAKAIRSIDLENSLLIKKHEILFKMKKYADAEKLLFQVQGNGYTYKIDNKRRLYEKLARVSHALGKNEDAYNWQKKCNILSDSMYEAQLDKDMIAIEAKFKNSEKENAIVKLKAEKKRRSLIIKIKN
ncbi:hypothetical protein SAMN05421594_2438 [Chryseobacterium oleae]|uniref:Tetratricopeptide repeat-containing protein n=2 Tax=Chryseobacterium oleae TaxID=491207 RepID=A0A1I4YI41_CHROL|nr:hypothetical protein SAMN05421594_2438 [Chryseobacterium oleae]